MPTDFLCDHFLMIMSACLTVFAILSNIVISMQASFTFAIFENSCLAVDITKPVVIKVVFMDKLQFARTNADTVSDADRQNLCLLWLIVPFLCT